jgi:hypothetical protein
MNAVSFAKHDCLLVNRVRLSGTGPDGLAARQRVEDALTAIVTAPESLGPSAILCVRTLRVGLPRASPRGYQSCRARWGKAVMVSLARLAMQAARPALEAVGANAQAVLFADRAEMLACLARDWSAGVLAPRWWWQGLFHGADLNVVVLPAWLEAPEHVPTALARLAAAGTAQPFVRMLGSRGAGTLVRQITQTHALALIRALLDRAPGVSVSNTDSPELATSATAAGMAPDDGNHKRLSGLLESSALAEAVKAPPWQRWVPEAAGTGLGMEQQCFLGITLMLQRAAHVVHSNAFARDVRRWRHSIVAETSAQAPLRLLLGSDAAPRTSEPVGAARLARPQLPDAGRSSVPSRLTTDEQAALADAGSRRSDASAAESPLPVNEAGREESASSACEPVPSALTARRPLPGWQEASPFLRSEATATELGGLFYLINLGLFLDLYGDFTSPARPGLALFIWDFVFLLGRRLLRSERTSDPVWDLLTHLAGRDADTPPGFGYVPSDVWRLPVEWLRPFPEPRAWSWDANEECLWVCHPEGFRVLDVPRDGADELQQLALETRTYAAANPLTLQRGVSEQATTDLAPLDRWLALLVPYVHARLGHALRLAQEDDVGELLLVHRARVVVSATRVDVTLSLAELPCAIRLAGLDRDPGWVPAAGRFVAFHFE